MKLDFACFLFQFIKVASMPSGMEMMCSCHEVRFPVHLEIDRKDALIHVHLDRRHIDMRFQQIGIDM